MKFIIVTLFAAIAATATLPAVEAGPVNVTALSTETTSLSSLFNKISELAANEAARQVANETEVIARGSANSTSKVFLNVTETATRIAVKNAIESIERSLERTIKNTTNVLIESAARNVTKAIEVATNQTIEYFTTFGNRAARYGARAGVKTTANFLHGGTDVNKILFPYDNKGNPLSGTDTVKPVKPVTNVNYHKNTSATVNTTGSQTVKHINTSSGSPQPVKPAVAPTDPHTVPVVVPAGAK